MPASKAGPVWRPTKPKASVSPPAAQPASPPGS
jgi:hypothetical protein